MERDIKTVEDGGVHCSGACRYLVGGPRLPFVCYNGNKNGVTLMKDGGIGAALRSKECLALDMSIEGGPDTRGDGLRCIDFKIHPNDKKLCHSECPFLINGVVGESPFCSNIVDGENGLRWVLNGVRRHSKCILFGDSVSPVISDKMVTSFSKDEFVGGGSDTVLPVGEISMSVSPESVVTPMAAFVELKDPMKKQIGGSHYKKLKIDPLEYALKNGLDFAQGEVIKYVTRFRDKNGREDLEKAKHVIDRLIQHDYGSEG